MPPSTPLLEIDPAHRVAFVGKTGSGKTTLARQLVAGLDRVIVIDPKGSLYGQWDLEEWSDRETVKRLDKGEPVRVRVPVPVTDDVQEALEPVFYVAYAVGGVTVYIDELYGVLSEGKRPGKYFRALYTRGREFGIGVWAAVQRPTWVPLFTLSEAEWSFTFRLQMKEDRKRMAAIVGPELEQPIPSEDPYGFWMYFANWESPVYCPGLDL